MEYAKKVKRTNKRNLISAIYEAEGSLTLIFNAPGAAPAFMKPFMRSEHELDEDKFERVLREMKRAELLEVEKEAGGVTLHLTKAGEKKAKRYSLDHIKIARPERWDGLWRVVMFDVPTELRVARNYFKQRLDQLGFIQIQESIYGHPFPCEKEIELIRSVYEIKPYVKIMKANHFEGEEKHLARFGLGREVLAE